MSALLDSAIEELQRRESVRVTRLEVPAEYVPLLNWEMDRFGPRNNYKPSRIHTLVQIYYEGPQYQHTLKRLRNSPRSKPEDYENLGLVWCCIMVWGSSAEQSLAHIWYALLGDMRAGSLTYAQFLEEYGEYNHAAKENSPTRIYDMCLNAHNALRALPTKFIADLEELLQDY